MAPSSTTSSSPSPSGTTPAGSTEGLLPALPAGHGLGAAEVAAHLGVDPTHGLSDDEARTRLHAHGPNRLVEPERRSAWRRLGDQFANPIIAVLVGAAVLAGVVGDLKDALVIAAVLVLNGILGFVQEGRAEHALAALEGMLEQVVTVRRDGNVVEIAAVDLVVGDVVLLEAGDRVPADGRVLLARAAAADESTLTGESVPVDKHERPLAAERPELGGRTNELFMNTTLVRGRIELVVTRTGMATEVGRIARLLSATVDRATPLEEQLGHLGRRLVGLVGVAVALVFALALVRGTPLGDAALEAVALGVAAIPEGLPAVVTVTLAVGVAAMARERAIVRRLASVETLGTTTAICTDKTGTLTRNRMTPVAVWHAGRTWDLRADPRSTPALRRSLVAGVQASDATLGATDDDHLGDPTEVAILLAARSVGVAVADQQAATRRLAELPFDPAKKLMATVVTDVSDVREGLLRLAVKGAPDELVARSTRLATTAGPVHLDDHHRRQLDDQLAQWADQGWRMLAVATGDWVGPVADDPDAIVGRLGDLTLEAVVAMVDPPRDGVADALARCRTAGIDVRMVTGDHPATARAIARAVGITGEVLTGAELDDLDDAQLARRIGDVGVVARVSPEHKVRVVDALHARGEVVAMTGDGVNDAAALRRADVGVAMGITGTEVTREAADIVLADDDFTTIVTAVERGRAIHDNLTTFVRFQLTTNLAAIATLLAAGLLALPSPFSPLQILFVNLVADGPPAMALGVDRARPDVMHRPPRGRTARILDARVLRGMLPTVAVMAAATLGVVVATDPETRTTMAFTTFVLLQLGNALAVRATTAGVLRRHLFTNRWLWGALALVLGGQVAVVHLPAAQALFDTVDLSWDQWVLAAGLGMLPIALAELTAWIGRRRQRARVGRPTRRDRQHPTT
ncbi:cation-translocating P-type ATPase [Salsipaludibacter albus]|uniref:cation-translocating P-type ATPase n=1 Tax=Salsipaludibacter albus TaxID=2849650 RepID=UPI001EE496ED|nr:cation-transporting P-type ATPase [Salsipaludibacter albus]MBY5161005.1 cation-transporting P-type ATPase [Salsipaludibacter albus]